MTAFASAACGGPPDAADGAAPCAPARPVPLPGVTAPALLVNAYYLQEEAARAVRRGEAGSAVVEEVFAKATALGVGVVRANGFNDGEEKVGDSAIQVAPGVYDEVALRGLDLVLASARARGVRLVLPLGNAWDDYGGVRRYVRWAGLAGAVEADGRFYTDRRVVALYRAHVTTILSRVNTLDGLRYGEHPAVLAFELLNEPRAELAGRAALRAWIDELGLLVRSLAPGRLVGTGEEGIDAEQFALDTASPSVDYGSVHLFPESWGEPAARAAQRGARFIEARAATARALGKPLVLGEFGLRNDGALALAERRAAYRTWLACARATGVALAGPWLFADDARPDGWDPFTFYWRTGTEPSDPVNRYADLLRDAAAAPVAAATP